MNVPRFLQPLDRAAGAWRARLIDPVHRDRAVLVSLAVYVVLWTVYGTIAKGSQGLHPDMTELVAWSRDLSLGYLKHPPLGAWVVAAWFAVFPVAEWSYYLLAMLMPAIALWFAWKLSEDYLDIEKRVAALVLLTLVPFFNFHALKYNVNTVLMPLWAATTFWFLRSYRTREPLYAALAGIGAAGCMLGKYWSIFLLAGLFLAAVIDRRRVAYFLSAAPWITLLVGWIVLGPHISWLVQNDFAPFGYAMTVHGDRGFANALHKVVNYLGGSLAYAALPIIIVLCIVRPRLTGLIDMIWPADTERRLVAAAFWLPLLLPAIAALATGTDITPLWSMPGFTLLPVLLLSPPAVKSVGTRCLLLAAVAFPLVAVLISPVIAIKVQQKGPMPASAHAQLLAVQVERAWHQATAQPLRFVGGDPDIAYGIATYAPDKPRALPDMRPPGAAELNAGGQVLMCIAEDLGCVHTAERRAPYAQRIEGSITRNYLDYAGQPQRYTILLAPPK